MYVHVSVTYMHVYVDICKYVYVIYLIQLIFGVLGCRVLLLGSWVLLLSRMSATKNLVHPTGAAGSVSL